jgi:hypothetical protein
MSYANRLDKLEATIEPEREPKCCIIWGDGDADDAIARFRAANDWPDDGRHPIAVLRVSWPASALGDTGNE